MSLATNKNLELAWKRVRTAQNVGYKRFYRRVFDGLDIGLDYQLASLRASIRVHTYQPHPPQRVLAAKPSGLQRPLTFLDPRDQIVLQAIVNLASVRMEPKRRLAIARSVCSNRLVGGASIHFFKPWNQSYGLFRKRIEAKLKAGYAYAADFDLASFYDTISHTRLAESVFGRNRHLVNLLQRCLLAWSPRRLRHGLPQGPAACDYLAECYLSAIDADLMKEKIAYLRYVDDIIIFGKAPSDVQAGVLRLEALCREHGLIPQAGKFKPGRKVKSAAELVKAASGYSYGPPTKGKLLSKADTVSAYTAAVSRKTRIILNPTLAKRALFKGSPTNQLVSQVLKDLEKNPAFIEAYATYLQRFGYKRRIANSLKKLITRGSPYLFVQGEYWNILLSSSKTVDPAIVALARRQLAVDGLPATLRLALYAALLKDGTRQSTKALIRALRRERTDWVRAWTLSHFRRVLAFPEAKRFASSALKKDSLTACAAAKLQAESVVLPPTFPLPKKPSATATGCLRRLGIVRKSAGRPPDAIGTLLSSGFGVVPWKGWRRLLGADYEQARICLQLGLGEFDGNPSSWMGNVDSFNDVIVRRVMDAARTRLNPPTLAPARNVRRKNRLTDYGYFLSNGQWFQTTHPAICRRFKDFHDRRNHLTSSHAFDSLTSAPSKPLKHSERQVYVRGLRAGYTGLQRLAATLI